jgi:DUF1009 family protein
MRRIGLIAGGGQLPVRIVEKCRREGDHIITVAIENHADDILPMADNVIRMGATGKIIDFFRANDVTELVMAGPVKRPSLTEIRPDGWGTKFLFRSGAGLLGDDGLLSAIARELEKEGFRIIGAADILDEVIASAGLMAGPEPSSDNLSDIERGIAVLEALSPVDVGQAVVIQSGLVLGVEAIEGTDALIRRCAALRREGPAPVLVKGPKTSQDRRVDLPTIGIETFRALKETGFAGAAVGQGGTMVMERPEVEAFCKESGLFLYGFQTPEKV